MSKSFLSFDTPADEGFDLPAAQREFNRRLALMGPFTRTDTTRGRAAANVRGRKTYTQHALDLAADIRTRDLTDEEIRALIARARAAGLVAVPPEAEVKLGNPPHLHVQMFPAGTIPKRVYTQIGVQIQETP